MCYNIFIMTKYIITFLLFFFFIEYDKYIWLLFLVAKYVSVFSFKCLYRAIFSESHARICCQILLLLFAFFSCQTSINFCIELNLLSIKKYFSTYSLISFFGGFDYWYARFFQFIFLVVECNMKPSGCLF